MLEPGITGTGAPVHGALEAPGEPVPVDAPLGVEGFASDPRLCLRWWGCFPP